MDIRYVVLVSYVWISFHMWLLWQKIFMTIFSA